MKKIFNLIMPLFLSLLIVLSSMSIVSIASVEPPQLDESKAYIKIYSVEANAGEKVEVPIILGNNPGIYSAKINIKFDTSVLAFDSIKPGTVFSESEYYYGPTDSDVINIAFESDDISKNNKNNGVLVTLVFNVSQNASGTTPVSFTNYNPDEYFSCSAKLVPFTFGNGAVIIPISSPSGLNVKQVTNKKAVVSWNAVDGVDGYEVYRKVGALDWQFYKTFDKNTTSFTENSLKAGKNYAYKVRAFADNQISEFSEQKSIKTYKLGKVSNVSATVKGRKVNLKWKKVTNAQKYQVFVSLKKKSGYKRVSTVKTNKATIKLKANKKYFVKIKAMRTVGSAKSEVFGNFSKIKTIKTK